MEPARCCSLIDSLTLRTSERLVPHQDWCSTETNSLWTGCIIKTTNPHCSVGAGCSCPGLERALGIDATQGTVRPPALFQPSTRIHLLTSTNATAFWLVSGMGALVHPTINFLESEQYCKRTHKNQPQKSL